MTYSRALTIVSIFAGCIALNAEAADSIATFNEDIPGGEIGMGGFINGMDGGSGWSGSWFGSESGMTVLGDLTSSLYTLRQQTGTTPKRYVNPNATGLRQNFRRLRTAITGEVWFSFVAMTTGAPSGAGLSFNAPTEAPFNNPGSAFLQFLGTDLVYRFGDAANVTLTNRISLVNPALVVGQMIVNGGGAADSIKLWINPDLVANPSILSHTPTVSSSEFNFADTINHVGLIAYGNANASGHVDALRISGGGGDQEVAIQTVTGVPEPATAVLLGAGLMVIAGRRRRR